MSLVRWFRKNNKKVMAVVVVVIMLGFVAGPALRWFGRGATAQDRTVAYFGLDNKITNYDLALARQELELLKMLRADLILKSIAVPLFRTQDLSALLLGELLFAERRISPVVITRLKQIIRANEFRISDIQINDIYRRAMGGEVYWLLLKNEAQLAGIRESNETARTQLAGIIPQLFNGATYSQLMSSIVNRQGIPEKEILTTFSKLLAVVHYARMICATEDITSSQIIHNVSWENETIDAEFVKFDSAVFAEAQDEPTQQEISAHFDKYKKIFAGAVSDQNPYGFGYKLPDRIQLEYIAVKLDDISAIVTAPTHQETEEYYQKYRKQFTESVPSDPNDPNSTPIEQTKSYAEVAGIISNLLMQNKINSKAERILQETQALTEAALQDTDTDLANLSDEQFKQTAGDYETAAEQLRNKYKIKVYTGQTGLLSVTDIRTDKHLGTLYLQGYGYNPVGLAQIVFALDQLQASELGPFDVSKPRLYENIGPLRDITIQVTGQTAGKIMAIVRVLEAEKASEPESIEQTFSKASFMFDEEQQEISQDIYSVREKAEEDLKRLAAMEMTKNKAEEFIGLVVEDGWEAAIEKFNELYTQQDKDLREPEIPATPDTEKDASESFKLQDLTNLRRISRIAQRTVATQSRGNPAAQLLIDGYKRQEQFIDRLYSLIPPDSNTVDTVPFVLEFKPDMSYYCLKNVSIKRLNREQYERMKALRVYKEDFVQSQSLAPVHFNPENILKRMNFRLARQNEKTADANAPAEPKEVL
jgi:hypothetical protein